MTVTVGIVKAHYHHLIEPSGDEFVCWKCF